MIVSFKCKKTQKLFETDSYVAKFDQVGRVAKRKLLMLHETTNLNYLQKFPNNRLEKLKHDRLGRYSIRINDQYRICFIWYNGQAYEVEIVDYH